MVAIVDHHRDRRSLVRDLGRHGLWRSFPGYITVANINNYLTMLFGLSAATFALQVNRVISVPLRSVNFLDRLGRPGTRGGPERQASVDELVSAGHRGRAARAPRADREHAARTAVPASAKAGLSVRRPRPSITAGCAAVDGVSLAAPMGAHHRADRAQRGRQDHHLQRLLGPAQADRGGDHPARARSDRDRPVGALALWARAHLPEGRVVQLADRARERRARPGGLHGRGQPLDPARREPPRTVPWCAGPSTRPWS